MDYSKLILTNHTPPGCPAIWFSRLSCHVIVMTTGRKVCRYPPGQCPWGEGCMFYHDLHAAQQNHSTCLTTLSASPKSFAAHPVITESHKTVTAMQSARVVSPCKYYLRGSCRYGNSCHSLHSPVEDFKQPQPTFCKFFFSTGCRSGDACRFSHENNSLTGASTDTQLSTLSVS